MPVREMTHQRGIKQAQERRKARMEGAEDPQEEDRDSKRKRGTGIPR